MATGDQADAVARLRRWLPGWFGAPGVAPVLDALLSGPAKLAAGTYDLIGFADRQVRIATATGGWLDLISADFFGGALKRRAGQGDDSFRARLRAELLRPRATRGAMRRAILDLTGFEPIIIELSRPLDTRVWAGSVGATWPAGYGVAGAYGSAASPGQVMIQVRRSLLAGVPLVAGWGVPAGAFNTASRLTYAAADQAAGAVTDADIYATIEATRPAGVAAWVAISN